MVFRKFLWGFTDWRLKGAYDFLLVLLLFQVITFGFIKVAIQQRISQNYDPRNAKIWNYKVTDIRQQGQFLPDVTSEVSIYSKLSQIRTSGHSVSHQVSIGSWATWGRFCTVHLLTSVLSCSFSVGVVSKTFRVYWRDLDSLCKVYVLRLHRIPTPSKFWSVCAWLNPSSVGLYLTPNL